MRLSDYVRASDFAMPPEFWDDFVAHRWEKGHFVFSAPARGPALSQAEVLDVVRASAGVRGTWLRMDGKDRPLEDFAPAPEDVSVEDWIARAKTRAGGCRDLFLYAPSISGVSERTFARARSFLHPLIERVGLPGTGVDVDLFVGDYAVTPTRIHRDGHNFSFALRGRKTMLFWPWEHIAGEMPSELREKGRKLPKFDASGLPHDFDHYVKSAISVTIEEGQCLYWPSSYWHVGLGDGSIAQTMNIALYPWDTSLVRLTLAEMDHGVGRVEHYPREGAALVPSSWERAIDQLEVELQRVVAKLRADSAREWALRRSSQGLPPAPLGPCDGVQADDTLLGDSRFDVFTMDASESLFGRVLVLAANGRSLTLADDGGVDTIGPILRLAKQGARFRLRDLFPGGGDEVLARATSIATALVQHLVLFVEPA